MRDVDWSYTMTSNEMWDQMVGCIKQVANEFPGEPDNKSCV